MMADAVYIKVNFINFISKCMYFSDFDYDIFDMIQMFTQHLMRYELVIGNIKRYAEKYNKKELEKSARLAMDLMSDIARHVDKFVIDNKHMKDVKTLMDKICYLPDNMTSQGFLKNTLEVSKLKLLTSGKEYSLVTMLCFEYKVLFYCEENSGTKRRYVKDMDSCYLMASMSK